MGERNTLSAIHASCVRSPMMASSLVNPQPNRDVTSTCPLSKVIIYWGPIHAVTVAVGTHSYIENPSHILMIKPKLMVVFRSPEHGKQLWPHAAVGWTAEHIHLLETCDGTRPRMRLPRQH